MFQIQYELKTQSEVFGSLHLEVECLKDLNETIDQVFKYLEESGDPRQLEELCPYFGIIWPSARGLASFLSELPDSYLSKQTVLELGCGLALPSMVAAKKGASVIATDFHPEVEALFHKNRVRNQISHLQYERINWEAPTFSLQPQKPDWIIGSDLLYEQRFSKSLARTIHENLKKGGKAVIADPGRPYLQSFVDEMTACGFKTESQVWKVPHPPTTQEVFVLVFTQ